MNRNDFPSEEEQFNAYKAVTQDETKASSYKNLDIGGDKDYYLEFPKERILLGCRAIRFCLGRIDYSKHS